jgi:CRISPR-associated protein Csb2
MTTAIAFRFPLGRYHGNPWGRNANEGAVDWPPEPWRVLRSLFATWKARAPQLSEATVLGLLEKLAELPDYIVPEYVLAHTRHYMPDKAGRTDKVFDAFAVIDREDPLVVMWSVELTREERSALRTLCELLPHLGRAESVCDAALLEECPRLSDGRIARPARGEIANCGTTVNGLLVPTLPLDIDALILRTSDIRRRKRLDPSAATRIDYVVPAPSSPTRPVGHMPRGRVIAVRFAIASRALPSRYAAVAMADALRQAAMSRYGQEHDGRTSALLSGKDAAGTPLQGHRHAHYFAFTASSKAHSECQLDTAVVWAPAGFAEDELTALIAIPGLRGRSFASDFRPCRLGLEATGEAADVIPELAGPSRVWESFTPFVPPRHPHRATKREEFVRSEVERELGYIGLPLPASVTVLRGDALSFRRHRLKERLSEARTPYLVRIVFAQPVRGPICLGVNNHFGLGLLQPAGDC